MPDINTAYNLAVALCQADYTRYSQEHRRAEWIDGLQYFDCSSFISYCLTEAGFFSDNPWFTTYNMVEILTNIGFTLHNSATTEWKNGDILLSSEHTEMVYNGENLILMGAHTDRNPPLEQVSIRRYPADKSELPQLLRAPSSFVYQWYATHPTAYQQYPIGSTEADNNAMKIYEALTSEGWTVEAIAGAVGNIQYESGMNPWQWEGLNVWYPDDTSTKHGYGLVQFTPNGKYINSAEAKNLPGYSPYYIGSQGHSPEDGNAQILFVSRFGDWVTTRIPEQFRMSYEEYKHSTADPDFLCASWLWGYEFPGDPWSTLETRREATRYYYELFKGSPPVPPHPPQPPVLKPKGKWIYWCRSYKPM